MTVKDQEALKVEAVRSEIHVERGGATKLCRDVVAMSVAIDSTYPTTLCTEAVQRRRIDKLATEVGEVLDAYNGLVGENPRKGVSDTHGHVLEELLDVATCALAAYEHMTGNRGRSVAALISQTATKRARLLAAVTA